MYSNASTKLDRERKWRMRVQSFNRFPIARFVVFCIPDKYLILLPEFAIMHDSKNEKKLNSLHMMVSMLVWCVLAAGVLIFASRQSVVLIQARKHRKAPSSLLIIVCRAHVP
eukprot:92055-Amorphochlora_amoeboformis.AAC.1